MGSLGFERRGRLEPITLTWADLAPLIGAGGFQRSHPVAKARADLTGLLYADGIHDSLYRSGGVNLLTATWRPAPTPARAA